MVLDNATDMVRAVPVRSPLLGFLMLFIVGASHAQDGPAITTFSLPGGEVTVPYLQTLQATGGTLPYTWSLASGTLPNGLTLSSAGVIGGTPVGGQTALLVVQVTDTVARTDTQPLSIVIVGEPLEPLRITTFLLPNGEIGLPYEHALQATGGVPPYSWSLPSSPRSSY